MTFEEAAKIICNVNNFSFGRRNGKHLLKTALLKALEAIGMQIPQKPITQEEYSFVCPVCQQDLGITQEDISIYDMTPPRHCECGQALDWSDKNEN